LPLRASHLRSRGGPGACQRLQLYGLPGSHWIGLPRLRAGTRADISPADWIPQRLSQDCRQWCQAQAFVLSELRHSRLRERRPRQSAHLLPESGVPGAEGAIASQAAYLVQVCAGVGAEHKLGARHPGSVSFATRWPERRLNPPSRGRPPGCAGFRPPLMSSGRPQDRQATSMEDREIPWADTFDRRNRGCHLQGGLR